jgi:hypothetical protein
VEPKVGLLRERAARFRGHSRGAEDDDGRKILLEYAQGAGDAAGIADDDAQWMRRLLSCDPFGAESGVADAHGHLVGGDGAGADEDSVGFGANFSEALFVARGCKVGWREFSRGDAAIPSDREIHRHEWTRWRAGFHFRSPDSPAVSSASSNSAAVCSAAATSCRISRMRACSLGR